MRTPTRLRAAVLFGPIAAVTLAVTAAPASAVLVEFPQVPTFLRDTPCGATIRSWADTSPQWPGRAIISVQATPVVGYTNGEYSFAPQCETLVTVAWRNVNTGRVGEYRVPLVAGIYGSIQYAMFQDTDPGHVVVTVFTDMPNVPQHGAFDVPADPKPAPPPPSE
ncbi:hypothetical protein JK358_16325 [Nocardia sp. 2]|uniref:Uncharacterized protein n=1 Tax=Nocardia acididurans TaxID=2802282 RepID=A0ABS1M5T9_9NOCA|nr:hypothetical protein [Nocardia acididurans]MBL1075965.1 hypothetical protein [Nocardia acididurans]